MQEELHQSVLMVQGKIPQVKVEIATVEIQTVHIA